MNSAPHRRRRNRGGWFITDAIVAMGIILILIAALATAATRDRRGGDRLADSREAIRLAEQTLTALQAGAAPPTPLEGATIEITPLHSVETIPGFAWVRVQVTNHSRIGSLTGLARVAAVKDAKP
jgi:type II secretory pathway pseudopilin PulG